MSIELPIYRNPSVQIWAVKVQAFFFKVLYFLNPIILRACYAHFDLCPPGTIVDLIQDMTTRNIDDCKNGNPIIRHKFTSDPTVIVHHDKVYLFTGHDESDTNDGYRLTEWLCFSSHDLISWTEHPIDFKPTDFAWAKGDAYASKVIVRDNSVYIFVSLTHGTIEGEALGIAVSDKPEGPFRDAVGKALITSNDLRSGGRNFDPSVFIDDDGKAYIFWGKGVCYFARLGEGLLELESEITTIDVPGFQEGVHLHKKNNWYYLSYGYNFPEKVGYMMSRNIHGPWEFKGILNEIPGNCETNRPAIIDFKGSSYFFYHNGALPGGGSYRRSVCIDRLYYNKDGTMKRVVMTSEGIVGRR